MKCDTGEQQKSPLSRERIDDRLDSSDTRSTDLAPHQIVDGSRAGTSTRVEVDDQGAVDGKDGRGAIGNDVLEDDGGGKISLEGKAVGGRAGDEQRGDPPGIAHAGGLDGEVGMGLGVDSCLEGKVVSHAVFALGGFVVIVHQIANCV